MANSFPTQPVYVHNGDWSETSRQHPVMEWMERYTKEAVDVKEFDKPAERSKWLTDDHVLVKSTGEVREGGDASWKALSEEIYAPLKEHIHRPSYALVIETGSDTWELTGIATLFWNLQIPGQGMNVAGPDGKTWDGAIPSAYKFAYRRDGGEIKVCRTEIFSDPSATLVAMLKSGMLKPEDLMK